MRSKLVASLALVALLLATFAYLGCGPEAEDVGAVASDFAHPPTQKSFVSSPAIASFDPIDDSGAPTAPYFPKTWHYDGGEVDSGPTALILVEGDSLSADWPRPRMPLWLRMGERVFFVGLGTSGSNLLHDGGMLAKEANLLTLDAGTQWPPAWYPEAGALPGIKLAVILGGSNDLKATQLHQSDASVADVVSGLVTWCANASAAGYRTIYIETPRPRADVDAAAMAEFIGATRASCPCDMCVPLWDDLRMADMSCDGTHPCTTTTLKSGGAGTNDGTVRISDDLEPYLVAALLDAGMTPSPSPVP